MYTTPNLSFCYFSWGPSLSVLPTQVTQNKNLNLILDTSISLIPENQSTANPVDLLISLQSSNF